ncbi:hypothetical protein AMECASPLE_038964 [Ameca splendens]|uniref:Uncharacterized protein n=1 Tax=Ameca splendens TaxID=208324 RepID=A0ABV0YVE2_9TELE
MFSVQEREANVPSAQAAALRCQRIWRKARMSLVQSRTANWRQIPARQALHGASTRAHLQASSTHPGH